MGQLHSSRTRKGCLLEIKKEHGAAQTRKLADTVCCVSEGRINKDPEEEETEEKTTYSVCFGRWPSLANGTLADDWLPPRSPAFLASMQDAKAAGAASMATAAGTGSSGALFFQGKVITFGKGVEDHKRRGKLQSKGLGEGTVFEWG